MTADHPFEKGVEGCDICGQSSELHRLTTDRDDSRLGYGVDEAPIPQHDAYLVLSDAERAAGFVRPVRRSYVHVGPPGPRYELRDLTPEQARYRDRYVKFEPYPEGEAAIGRYWTQEQLDAIGKGCGSVTTMSQAIAETYARNPSFYGATYCVRCQKHLPVGPQGEFVWDGTDERVGT